MSNGNLRQKVRYVCFCKDRENQLQMCEKNYITVLQFEFFEINLSRCMLGRKASIKNVRIAKEPKRRYHESFQ